MTTFLRPHSAPSLALLSFSSPLFFPSTYPPLDTNPFSEKLVPIDPSKLQPPLFPRNKRDERGTLLTPHSEGLGRRQRISKWFWELGARLREPDMKYATKTGIAGAMLAAPAYIERTRPIFLEYRGEWALIAFFATMSPTVGQTNFL